MDVCVSDVDVGACLVHCLKFIRALCVVFFSH